MSHFFTYFYTSSHISGVVLWYHIGCPSVCPSVHASISPYICFQMITWEKVKWFSPNLVCALVLWRSGLGLLMGKFRQFLTELSAGNTSGFSLPDDSIVTYQWIFTKLAMCIDIIEVCSGNANGQISLILIELSALDMIVVEYYHSMFLFFIYSTKYLVERQPV